MTKQELVEAIIKKAELTHTDERQMRVAFLRMTKHSKEWLEQAYKVATDKQGARFALSTGTKILFNLRKD